MRKIVLPLVETERSLLALQYVKKHFSSNQVEIILVMADESLPITATRDDEEQALSTLEQKLQLITAVLKNYQVITKGCLGKAGQNIVKIAKEYNADYIIMTKSAQPDMLSMIGKTADYVINNASCNVLIVSENKTSSGEYKGLIYKKAQAVVNLRGQIGDKQSECLLPSVDADCNYHFDVTVGKIRFFHTTYNPETSNWDLPPSGEQLASIDVAAGETADILVKANSVDGKADRIRIINRGMKQEAVFSYKITAAAAPEPMELPEAPGAMPAPAVISLDATEEETVEHFEFNFEDIEEKIDNVVETVNEEEVTETVTETETETELASIVDEFVEEEEKAEEASVIEEEVETEEIEAEETVTEIIEAEEAETEIVEIEEFDAEEAVNETLETEEIEVEEPTPGTPMAAVFAEEVAETEEAVEPVPEPAFYEPATDDFDAMFNGLFDAMPEPEPIEEVPVATLQNDFDELINQFRTGQMNYVEENPVDLDDFI